MGDMKSALRASLKAEKRTVQDRFKKAEAILTDEKGDEKTRKAREGPGEPKVIRDTFSFPESDYRLIAELQERCLNLRLSITKSEILRAGLKVLSALSDEKLVQAAGVVERVKTGRPAEKG
jgi:hypothetical protein